MSKQLHVAIGDVDLRRFRRAAQRDGITLSEWVRRSLGRAEREAAVGDGDEKLRAIRTAATHTFPTADIDQMLR